ncbi:MAG: 16S rRNA (uracil(1498)-N(3))-methyltransferase [Nitrospira sp.]|nr:16S rRNA (uracil(1498)-N(3))-methyltransferase [Nitrospira sp.]MDH4303566.1 16S rRNA (uracil(1498)-N(3))-methyltransferase [Nitrospira sp.]MDH5192961.1 16S rRNA (uracil(1498)-N(3))-methyltransferase [Nitrospira sp.]
MPVFFISPESVTARTISITGDLVRHIKDSLRVAIGEMHWFGNGQDARYLTEITDISKHAITGQIVEMIQEPAHISPRLILGQSLLKGEKMDWVIQKATELGVQEIIPVESRHSVVQLKADRLDHQLTRWQRIALEAAQQSEQWRVPTIARPQSLTLVLTNGHPNSTILMLAERRNGKSVQAVNLQEDMSSSLLVLVGPEGGWSNEEMELAEQRGVEPVTLGEQILRAETAAIATISILQSRLGRLG